MTMVYIGRSLRGKERAPALQPGQLVKGRMRKTGLLKVQRTTDGAMFAVRRTNLVPSLRESV